MQRSVLLLLMSAIVLSGAVNFRTRKHFESEDSDYNHLSGQQLHSGVEKTISKRDAKDTSGSISEELTDGANEEVLDGMDSSMESSLGEKQKLILDERRLWNLHMNNLFEALTAICPDADFSNWNVNKEYTNAEILQFCHPSDNSGRIIK
ncbi:uncharacterized protein LOC122614095 [Drosophila teissieri]|uniref:uncharacterized protein LOC122614095 n=1 Tax=Drosophila teissieri TaxID=7243 RepID=UPI001CBA037B|nr:uncharacterized protein LOC122614095 [Drosophila teissieri]